ncbi:MAG: hypothetical protein JNJ47_06965 [Alphaproteobacteria bacterium]|nr:hypothetical protein [Alphaproteobacteria bacterium]
MKRKSTKILEKENNKMSQLCIQLRESLTMLNVDILALLVGLVGPSVATSLTKSNPYAYILCGIKNARELNMKILEILKGENQECTKNE